MTASHRLQLNVSPALAAALRQRAELEGVSVSRMGAQLLEAGLRTVPPLIAAPSPSLERET
jgi:hypothetical protein